MLKKLPVIVAIELLIGVIAFLLAGEKASFVEIVFFLTLGTLLIVLTVYGFRRFHILE